MTKDLIHRNRLLTARPILQRRTRTASLALLIAVSICALLAAAPQDAGKGKGKSVGDPYPLDTCAVAGTKLDSKGKPAVFVYEGREFRTCCKMCEGKFKKSPEKYIKKVDETIIKQQMASYPLTTCVVTKEMALESEDSKPIDKVVNNRLVRFCCKGCIRKFDKAPDRFLAELDKAVIAKQAKDYPLNVCPVSEEDLGSMGDAYDMVVANRLVRICCKGCVRAVKKNPAKYIAMLDDARKKMKGKTTGG